MKAELKIVVPEWIISLIKENRELIERSNKDIVGLSSKEWEKLKTVDQQCGLWLEQAILDLPF
jgi:hypothetical protein